MFSTVRSRFFMRDAAVRGPMPQSMRIAPVGERRTEQFPEEPLARIERERDIRVGRKSYVSARENGTGEQSAPLRVAAKQQGRMRDGILCITPPQRWI